MQLNLRHKVGNKYWVINMLMERDTAIAISQAARRSRKKKMNIKHISNKYNIR